MSARAIAASWPAPRLRALALAAVVSLLLGGAVLELLAGSPSAAVPARASSSGSLASLPASALGPLSGALGAADPAYHFHAAAGGFQTANPAQRFSVRAARGTVLLRARTLQLGLSLRGVERGGALAPVGALGASAGANRLSLRGAGVSEWFVNGPGGLEQGFTVARAPAGTPAAAQGAPGAGAGQLQLAISLSGNAVAKLAADGRSVRLSHAGGPSLRYGQLSATDARGRTLPSRLALRGGQLLLQVDSRGARFPLRIDPLVRIEGEEKLTAAEEKGAGRLGYTAALSADGNTALVGAPYDSGGEGAVWVFTRSAGRWSEQARLANPGGGLSGAHCGEELEEENECGFGQSVSLSSDGNTALVGDPLQMRYQPAEESKPAAWLANAGAAWVFTRSGAGWSSTAELQGGEEGSEGRFGKSVAISGDGHTALIGGPTDRGATGSAWVFADGDGGWVQQGPKLVGPGETGETRFGRSVALSEDGSTALVGAPNDDANVGAAWLFTRSGGRWSVDYSKLTGGGESGEGRFGFSVALSADAGTALVGAPRDGESEAERGPGAAFVFTHGGSGTWTQAGAKLTGSGEAGAAFGWSAALNADGSQALVGAPHQDQSRGDAWQFSRSGGGWTPAQLEAGAERFAAARLGASVALSANGLTALAGAPSDQAKVGAAWVFGPAPTLRQLNPKQGRAGTTVAIAGSHLEGATGVYFGGVPATSFKVEGPNLISAVAPPGEGEVEVSVSTPDGSTPTSGYAPGIFTYVGAKSSPGGGGGGSVSIGSSGSSTSGAGASSPTVVVLGFGPTSGGGCGVTLASRKIAVHPHSRALFRLNGHGVGTCRGKLRLRVTRRVKHRSVLKTIGTATFSILSGRSVVVAIRLNAAGRSMLAAGHGRLLASLLLVRQLPSPTLSQSTRVRLSRQKARRVKARTGTPGG